MFNFRKYSNNVSEIVIPDNVTLANDNFSGRFSDMKMLTSVVIPNRITNISSAYSNCTSLVRQPTCSDNVVDMSDAFSGCTNLNSTIAIGANVVNMRNAFYNCPNLEANCYFFSKKVNDVHGLFDGANTVAKKKTIYCDFKKTETYNVLQQYFGTTCYGGSCVTQTPRLDRNTGMYYSSRQNIYLVTARTATNNVAAEREKNGD